MLRVSDVPPNTFARETCRTMVDGQEVWQDTWAVVRSRKQAVEQATRQAISSSRAASGATGEPTKAEVD